MRHPVTSPFLRTLFTNTLCALFPYSEWPGFSRTKHRPLLCATNEGNYIAIRFHSANSMPHTFHCVHKTQISPTVFDFVFCDCQIIKALRERRIETHSCSNSHASKGFWFSVPSSKTRSNDLWSREPICQSAMCGRINIHGTPVLIICDVYTGSMPYWNTWLLTIQKLFEHAAGRLCAENEYRLSPPVWKIPFGYIVITL
jgi:hypothetical protein